MCVGTGPLATLDEYVERPFNDKLDARGGAMALWFALATAALGKAEQKEEEAQ